MPLRREFGTKFTLLIKSESLEHHNMLLCGVTYVGVSSDHSRQNAQDQWSMELIVHGVECLSICLE